MRVSYIPEQRARTIEVYKETGSYAETIRVLGHPPRHVLFDWVGKPRPRPKPKSTGKSAKRRG